MTGRFASLLRAFHERLFKYAWKFAVLGLITYAIDVGVFNLLMTTAFVGSTVPGIELWAKVLSTAVATIASWFGNRYWAFREHRRKNFWLELVEFAITSIIGLAIAELCLWFSHYVLGYTSLAADNISANVIGLVLATLFRFVMYRYLVFSPNRKDGLSRLQQEADELALDEAAALAAIDPAAADFIEETAQAGVDDD